MAMQIRIAAKPSQYDGPLAVTRPVSLRSYIGARRRQAPRDPARHRRRPAVAVAVLESDLVTDQSYPRLSAVVPTIAPGRVLVLQLLRVGARRDRRRRGDARAKHRHGAPDAALRGEYQHPEYSRERACHRRAVAAARYSGVASGRSALIAAGRSIALPGTGLRQRRAKRSGCPAPRAHP